MKRNNNNDKKGDLIIVLPGDNVTKYITDNNPSDESITTTTTTTPITKQQRTNKKKPKIGVGIRYDTMTNQFFATCSGRFECRNSGSSMVYYVLSNIRQRYRPSLEDRVIGIIEERIGSDIVGGDLYRVNINASHPAILCNLAFEGATKRNKPQFHPGQILYTRIISSIAATESASTTTSSNSTSQQQQNQLCYNDLCYDPITLSCVNGPHDGNIPRKDWMTNEGAYGELRGGTVCTISMGLARELLKPNNIVLETLATYNKTIQFEIAIGLNGLIWIHSTRPEYTILIQNAIQNSAVMTPEQIRSMVKSLVYTVEKQLQQDRDAFEE